MPKIELPPEPYNELPHVIVRDTDQIYHYVSDNYPVLIHRYGSTGDPFHLDVIATNISPPPLSQKQHREGINHEQDAHRLRLESRFSIPVFQGHDYVAELRRKYLFSIPDNAAITHLVRSTFTDKDQRVLRLALTDDQDFSVTTYAKRGEKPPYEFWLTNDRNVPKGHATSIAPRYNKENIGQIISKYLGLTWVVASALGDSTVPRADFLDYYAQNSKAFSRRNTRPKARTDSQRKLHNERVQSQRLANELNSQYAPSTVGNVIPLKRVRGLERPTLEEIELRIDILREPERAKRWGALAIGGILIHGDRGTGKTTLARAIAANADHQWHIKATDMIVEGNSDLTSEKIRQLSKAVQKVTTSGSRIGLVLEEMEPIIPKGSASLTAEEIRDFVKTAVANNRVLLVGTITKRSEQQSPVHALRTAGLFGLGYFDLHIPMQQPDDMSRRQVLTDLITEETVEGKRLFEQLDPDSMEELILYSNDKTVTEIEHAILSCRARKFREEIITGKYPGPVRIADIIEALDGGFSTEVTDNVFPLPRSNDIS